MSRREQIKMSEAEVASFLGEERILTCATMGPRGWPHLMPLWYVLRSPGTPPARLEVDGEAISRGSDGEAIPRGSDGEAIPRGSDGEAIPRGSGGEAISTALPEAGGEAISTGPRLWAWTYAASQKVRNLERDPRATLQIEAGEQYQELRGMMIESEAIVHRDFEAVGALGQEIFRRYASPRGEPPVEALPPEVAAMVDKQAAKRVALEFVERRRTSWDHRKLGGLY